MHQPEGFLDPNLPNHVYKLTKVLCGLKQAPRAWYDRLKTTLLSWNFTNAKSDTSLFYLKTETLSIDILIYVDDILITGNNSAYSKNSMHKLNTLLSLKDLGPVYHFLGVE